MIGLIAIGVGVAYIIYTFIYSVIHGYKDAAFLIGVASLTVACIIWCESAWVMML